MHIYDAVKYALNQTDIVVAPAPTAAAPLESSIVLPIAYPDTDTVDDGLRRREFKFCVCCCNNVAVRGNYCYECAEHHEAEAKRLRGLLRRAAKLLYQDGYDEAVTLYYAIEAEIGGDE